MSKDGTEDSAPTMIIPKGTEIEVDPHGQLSIRAPGNLVIQHSGSYGNIESRGGSIRIDKNVEVEAVEVRCADTCYVQGSLTAWRLAADSLHLEETARAQVVLQETKRLEIGRDARLVGNFDSEKELFLLFSRFAKQVRSLPFYFERKTAEGFAELPGVEEPAGAAPEDEAEILGSRETGGETGGEDGRRELPEPLFFALVLLERDAARRGYGPTSQRILDELIKLLQERDLETLLHTYRTLFGRIIEPHDDVRRAEDLVSAHFAEAAPARSEPTAAGDDLLES